MVIHMVDHVVRLQVPIPRNFPINRVLGARVLINSYSRKLVVVIFLVVYSTASQQTTTIQFFVVIVL